MATHLMMASKKGISSLQLHRMLGISKKSAWFLAHRICESLRDTVLLGGPLGGKGETVEVDETYVGGKAANRKNHVPPKEAVVSYHSWSVVAVCVPTKSATWTAQP